LAVDSFFGAAKEGTGGIDENPYSIVPKMYSWISFLNFSLKKTNPNSLFPKIGLKKKIDGVNINLDIHNCVHIFFKSECSGIYSTL
jgi:hypothetical protein